MDCEALISEAQKYRRMLRGVNLKVLNPDNNEDSFQPNTNIMFGYAIDALIDCIRTLEAEKLKLVAET